MQGLSLFSRLNSKDILWHYYFQKNSYLETFFMIAHNVHIGKIRTIPDFTIMNPYSLGFSKPLQLSLSNKNKKFML